MARIPITEALLIERYGLFGGGAGAAVASCMVILSTKVTTLLDYRIWVGTVMLGALGGAAFALTRRLEDLTIAIAADRRTGLKERFSTAVESCGFRQHPSPPDVCCM